MTPRGVSREANVDADQKRVVKLDPLLLINNCNSTSSTRKEIKDVDIGHAQTICLKYK